jgi:nitrite reductase (NADH) large subunit
MGKALERALWRMYAPHKVKLAVSGCPRNCAESGIKDVASSASIPAGKSTSAGNGGIKTEVRRKFLVKVKTADEVLEFAGAFLQLYREEGWYLERTVHYVARVGLDHVKKRVLDDVEGRRALYERLQFALDGEPDPWHEIAKSRIDLRQFEAIAP